MSGTETGGDERAKGWCRIITGVIMVLIIVCIRLSPVLYVCIAMSKCTDIDVLDSTGQHLFVMQLTMFQ